MPDFKGFSTAKQKTQVYNLWTSGTPDRKSTSAAKVKKKHEKKGDSQKKEENPSEKQQKSPSQENPRYQWGGPKSQRKTQNQVTLKIKQMNSTREWVLPNVTEKKRKNKSPKGACKILILHK